MAKCYKCNTDFFNRSDTMYKIGRTGLCEFQTLDECEKERNLRRAKTTKPGVPLDILKSEGWNLPIYLFLLLW
jgi:hypothetical protein